MRTKKVIIGLLIGCLITLLCNCSVSAASKNQYLQFKDQKISTVKLYVGQKKTIKVQITRKKYKNRDLVFQSSNQKIFTVNKSGKIRALRLGKAKLYVTIKGTKKRISRTIRIIPYVKLKSIKITNIPSGNLIEGASCNLNVSFNPKNASKKQIQWSSSDYTVAAISPRGHLKALSSGTAKIYAKIKGTSVKTSFKIRVSPDTTLKHISYADRTKITIERGQKKKLNINFYPARALSSQKKLSWKSSDDRIVTVSSDGTINALHCGEVTITATSDYLETSIMRRVRVCAKNGYLTKKVLDNLDLSKYNKLMIVAHPDDESLWGGAHLLSDDYFVLCMTNITNKSRKNQFSNAMTSSGEKYLMLGYPDLIVKNDGTTYRDNWNTDKAGIKKDLNLILSYKKWDEVVTHNPEGEYGHIHHKKTNQYVTAVFKSLFPNKTNLVYFGKYLWNPTALTVTANGGEKISDELAQKKRDMVTTYYNDQGAVWYSLQSIPYETWINAATWK